MAHHPTSPATTHDRDGDHDDAVNPFAGMPMFGDIARALQGQGPLNWDAARQFAMLGATQGQSESNVDPAVRIAYTDLARIAGMHVNDVTGADTTFPEPRIVTRGGWAHETLDAYRPLFTDMATSLGQQPDPDVSDSSDDPMMQMMAGLSRMMAPAMMGMSVGSMVGQLAQHVFGLHDLPIPRDKQEVVLVGQTIDEFAARWEIPIDQMRLWVLAHELSGFQVFSIAHLRDRPRRSGSAPRRRLPARPIGDRRQAGRSRSARRRSIRRPDGGAPAGLLRPRDPARGRRVRRPTGAAAAARRRRRSRRRATPTGSSTPWPFG